MKIQIRFSDGVTEERDADSPAIYDLFDPVLRHPSEERWYLWFPDSDRPLSFCGRSVHALATLRGGYAMVWRFTSGPTEPLAGEWQSAYVETREEQIERLTRERDAAEGKAKALYHVVESADVSKAAEHAAEKIRLRTERDDARRMVVIRSGKIKSSQEARELDALTDKAIEEGWLAPL